MLAEMESKLSTVSWAISVCGAGGGTNRMRENVRLDRTDFLALS